ncbi:MAG TPA: AAA family ATPase [Acidimicrobiales bacterium]|nr:AAA family ATPase [Acidimicrobiales bacterium]
MSPSDYLAIARRHWRLIAALVVVALAVVYWTSPDRARGTYESTHIMRVETDEGRSATSSISPELVKEYITADEVPQRAAAALGYEGDPRTLAGKLEVEADRTVGVVRITATDRDPDEAARIADAFATEVEAFLTEQEAAQQEEDAQALQAREDEVRGKIAALDAQIAAAPDNATLADERDNLVRQLGDIEDQQAAVTDEAVRFGTVQSAPRGTERDPLPGTRSREQRMALAGGVALVLGFGLAIALDRSDTRIRNRRSAEAHFGTPVLAEIPAFNLPARRRKLLVHDEPDSVRAEAFRTLRTAIMLVREPEAEPAERRHGGNGARPTRSVIMLTSAGPGEGKTTTAANLAVAYAESGNSVLVLSCDLWRSSAARHFGVKQGKGVSDLLAVDDIRLSDVVHDTDVPGVRVVTAGLAVRRAGGRLHAQRRMVDQARRLADVVILDTAPVLSAALTRELATAVDAVVVVCRVGRTPAGEAERCADLLSQLGAPVLGLALVGVSAPPFYDYFAYSSPRRVRREVARAQADAGNTAAGATAANGGSHTPGAASAPVNRPFEGGAYGAPPPPARRSWTVPESSGTVTNTPPGTDPPPPPG